MTMRLARPGARLWSGLLGILSIQTTEGRLDVALDRQAADAIVCAVNAVRTKLASNGG
jgi:hypothetical protein